MPMMSYVELKAKVNLKQVLDLIGYRWLLTGRALLYSSCPLGCGGHLRSCGMDLNKSIWHCFSCERGGNQLDLWAHAKSLDLYPASLLLCRRLGIEPPWITGP